MGVKNTCIIDGWLALKHIACNVLLTLRLYFYFGSLTCWCGRWQLGHCINSRCLLPGTVKLSVGVNGFSWLDLIDISLWQSSTGTIFFKNVKLSFQIWKSGLDYIKFMNWLQQWRNKVYITITTIYNSERMYLWVQVASLDKVLTSVSSYIVCSTKRGFMMELLHG